MYANDNDTKVPNNPQGRDLPWVSKSIFTNFFERYLVKNVPGAAGLERTRNDVLYCPTDIFHRAVEIAPGYDPNTDPCALIGYYYLPGRTDATGTGWLYNSQGLGEWHYKTKLGGVYRGAPIMIDRIQRFNNTWLELGQPASSHRGNGNIPSGANFLFEDGHVEWHRFNFGNPAMNERMVKRTAMRRAGEPQDVANAIVFLCSDLASYITGVGLNVSGGIELFTF